MVAHGGSGTGLAQDATLQAILAKLGVSTPSGGSGTGFAQDASLQALLLAIVNATQFNVVRVNFGGTGGAQASPYAAKPQDFVIADSSAGAIVINYPLLTQGQWVSVMQDSATAFTNTITCNPHAGDLDQPPPDNGTFVASFVMGPATPWTAKGMRVQHFNGGSAGGLLLA